jgi:hypothetical protein
MKTMKPFLILAAALALIPLGMRAADSASTIAFSDPTKPGTLKIRVWSGDVTIHGADVKEITVKASADMAEPTPRKDGMRVLSTSSSYALSEKDNVTTLAYGADGWTEGSADFDITVPKSTSIVVANTAHGDIECTDVEGQIDVRTVHGDVHLRNIHSGATVETMHGEIDVDVTSLAEGKPLSFTTMTGEVQLRVPSDLKATVQFRTHRGVIMTNFDDKVLVTKTEIAKRKHKSESSDKKDVADSDKESKAPKAESDDDWREDLKDSIREAAQDAAEAARDAAEAAREGIQEAKMSMDHGDMDKPMAPFPPLPPMTGGKTVSGTLNGGGVEIRIATLNGDITFKKAE